MSHELHSLEDFRAAELSPEASAVAFFEHCQTLVRRGCYLNGVPGPHAPAKERRPWKRMSPEIVAEVLRLLGKGLTQQQVADRVGFSQNKVCMVAQAHGIRPGKGCRQRAARRAEAHA